MDATLRIKNLSIALERLYRLTGSDWGTLRGEMENLLHEEIQAFREEKEKENQWPQRPARTNTTNTDDFQPLTKA